MRTVKIAARPFVKWAGGKKQLISDLQKKYPPELGKSIKRYCEPFVGGGAVFFDLLSHYELDEILINDINIELINTYRQIQCHVQDLVDQLHEMQDHFWPLNPEEQKNYYYDTRERFNYLIINGDESANIEKAALFVFLNKTCFNGLFRVNRQGLFNVPMGAYKNPIICDETNLYAISALLKNVKIKCGDYKACLSFITKDTFVYLDPPYRPLTVTANFTAYSENLFNDDEQVALSIFFNKINDIGAKVLLSNSDPKNSNEDDEFFDKLYKAYCIKRVTAKRMINCNGESRGTISELLISNYGSEHEMKKINKYEEMGFATENAAFEYLISSLKDTIRTYDFFVAWDKVLGNVSKAEVSLNIMNSLIGKENITGKLTDLIRNYPEIVPVIPLLIAVREKSIKIADLGGDIEYSFQKVRRYTEEEISKIVFFAEKCGLLKILSDKNIKNLVDYCVGVEVGLDTNARKNRSGTAMESLTEVYIKAICDNYGYRYITQATVAKIKAQFDREVPTDKSDRHFDFAIDTGLKIYLIEVNYYGGGGSKLKSVAGEFKSLFELVKREPNVGFIWVTDGLGWKTAKRPLRETFNATDYLMNIKMIESGLLEDIVTKGL